MWQWNEYRTERSDTNIPYGLIKNILWWWSLNPSGLFYKVHWKQDDYKEKQGMYSYCMHTLLTLVVTLLPSFFLHPCITVQANYTTNSKVLQVKYQLAISCCIWKYQPLCNIKGKGHIMIYMCRYWGVVEVQIQPLLSIDARKRWVVSNTPWLLYPGKDPVPTVQETGGPQEWSGQAWKIFLQSGFNPLIVQAMPVAILNMLSWPPHPQWNTIKIQCA